MKSHTAAANGLHFVADSPVAGLAIAQRRVGQPEATIIAVHGGLDRGRSFGRLARRSDAFDFVTYDRRGYQGSRNLTPLSLDHHIGDLVAVARREAECGPVIYFGHSYGGVVALGAALREPTLAQLIVVYESPLPWVLARDSARPPVSDDPEAEAESFFKRMVSHETWERLSESERDSRRRDGAGLLSDLANLRTGPPFDLAELTTPTLYVHGDAMHGDYYRALCAELARINPIIESREIANAGHGAHLTNPDQLAALLDELWRQRCA